MYWFFLAGLMIAPLAIAYGLWALSEDSRHRRRKVYEEDRDTAAEMLVWLAQHRARGQRRMDIPRKRAVIQSRRSSTL